MRTKTNVSINESVRSFDKHYEKTKSAMSNACRMCLAKRKIMKAIFEENEESRVVRKLIIECCPVQLTQPDILLPLICVKCRTELASAHDFLEECRQSEERLRHSYANLLDEPAHDCQERSFAAATISSNATNNPNATGSQSSLQCKATVDSERENNNSSDNRDRRKTSDSQSRKKKSEERKRKKIDDVAAENKKESNQRSSLTSLKGSEKQYLCDICSKTFASKSGLRFHLKTHTGSKPYSCRFCDKCFVIPSYRSRHERTHAGDKRFVCHVCSAAFASANGLKYHLSSHTGEANYRCDTCGKSFRRRKYLKEHVFTHTGERPFACKICSSAYANSGSLFVHEKRCRAKQTATAVPNNVNRS